MLRLLQELRERISIRREKPPDFGDLDRLVDADARQFGTVDPRTGLQWERLRLLMEMERYNATALRKTMPLPWSRPAASFALAAIVCIVIGLLLLKRASPMTYETAKGQQSTIMLSDSTEVTLNHTSELVVDQRNFRSSRQVTLRGEAYFRVRHNGGPFTVFTDVATIQVLGTEFNVRDRDNRLEVAVISGSVDVSVRKDGRDSTLVLAKEQLTTCNKGEFPAAAVLLPFAGYPGWVHGKFLFYRASLRSVCDEIEEQFDVTIRIKNPQLLTETLTGTVDGRNLDAALSTLAQLTGIKYRYENNGYTFY